MSARAAASWRWSIMRSAIPAGDGIILAFGCVGGRHRSVAAAEETADRLRKMDYEVEVIHRELAMPAWIRNSSF